MSDTPETERLRWQLIDRYGTGTFEEVLPKLAAMESQRNKAREQLASEKSTRNAIIAKGIEMERQLAEARQKLEIAMAANSDVERIAKERNEAQKAFAIATDQLVQVQGELRQAREENARLREALNWIAKRYDDSKPTHAVAMDAYEMSCTAKHALTP